MRRLIAFILTALVFLEAVPVEVAPSYAAEEKVAHRQVALAYFDVWKHSDGRWQDTNPNAGDGPDIPGQTGKKITFSPENKH